MLEGERDSRAPAWTYGCVGKREAHGSITGCTIHLENQILALRNDAEVRDFIVHETMHCFIMNRFGVDSQAVMAGRGKSPFGLRRWLGYGGMGFFVHLAETGTNPWDVAYSIGSAMTGGGDPTDAGWNAAHVTDTFVETGPLAMRGAATPVQPGKRPAATWAASSRPNIPRCRSRKAPRRCHSSAPRRPQPVHPRRARRGGAGRAEQHRARADQPRQVSVAGTSLDEFCGKKPSCVTGTWTVTNITGLVAHPAAAGIVQDYNKMIRVDSLVHVPQRQTGYTTWRGTQSGTIALPKPKETSGKWSGQAGSDDVIVTNVVTSPISTSDEVPLKMWLSRGVSPGFVSPMNTGAWSCSGNTLTLKLTFKANPRATSTWELTR